MMPTLPMTRLFQAAGWTNLLGMAVFSLMFTNTHLFAQSPVVFSPFGCLLVMLWGVAYLSVARHYRELPLLVAVFAIEKALYAATWLQWLVAHGHELPALFTTSPLTALFYSSYGVIDLGFGLVFLTALIDGLRARQLPP